MIAKIKFRDEKLEGLLERMRELVNEMGTLRMEISMCMADFEIEPIRDGAGAADGEIPPDEAAFETWGEVRRRMRESAEDIKWLRAIQSGSEADGEAAAPDGV